jgi:hypothetical protein
MKITRINHAAINVAGKHKECHEFYTGFMGLGTTPIDLPGFKPEDTKDLPVTWLEHNRVQIHMIGIPAKGEPREAVAPHVSWFVQDLEQTVSEIEERGLEMNILGEGRNRIIWVSDPAGNTVEFQQDPEF